MYAIRLIVWERSLDKEQLDTVDPRPTPLRRDWLREVSIWRVYVPSVPNAHALMSTSFRDLSTNRKSGHLDLSFSVPTNMTKVYKRQGSGSGSGVIGVMGERINEIVMQKFTEKQMTSTSKSPLASRPSTGTAANTTTATIAVSDYPFFRASVTNLPLRLSKTAGNVSNTFSSPIHPSELACCFNSGVVEQQQQQHEHLQR